MRPVCISCQPAVSELNGRHALVAEEPAGLNGRQRKKISRLKFEADLAPPVCVIYWE